MFAKWIENKHSRNEGALKINSHKEWQPLKRTVDFWLFLLLTLICFLVAWPVHRMVPACAQRFGKIEAYNGFFPKDWQRQKVFLIVFSVWSWHFSKHKTIILYRPVTLCLRHWAKLLQSGAELHRGINKEWESANLSQRTQVKIPVLFCVLNHFLKAPLSPSPISLEETPAFKSDIWTRSDRGV